jgi:hypothetical protein
MYQEPLYIVILRDPNANATLLAWHENNLTTNKQITTNRMLLFSQYELDKFRLTWPGPWGNIIVWDNWNRQHIQI